MNKLVKMEELEEKINGIKLKDEEEKEKLQTEKEETEKVSNRAMKLQKNKNKRDEKKKNKQNAKNKKEKEKNDNVINNADSGKNTIEENLPTLEEENTDNDEANDKNNNDTIADDGNKSEIKNKKIVLPIIVEYCKICSMPYEYCEYGNFYDECREENKDKYNYDISNIVIDTTAKKKVKRPEKPTNTKITIQKTVRAKKKVVTVVTGLHVYAKLDKMSKIFAKTFACGASVIKGTNNFPDHVDIQGDVGNSVVEVIMKNCPEITEDKFIFLAPK